MRFRVEFVAGNYMVIRYLFSGIYAVCTRDRDKYYGTFEDMRSACGKAVELAEYS